MCLCVWGIMLRRALKEFLKHSKESRGVLGQEKAQERAQERELKRELKKESKRESKQASKQANRQASKQAGGDFVQVRAFGI